jgi:ribA/ribD-fused uncharacterized protein
MPKRKSHTVYFYLPNESLYGIFCQWHPSAITIPISSLTFLTSRSSTTLPSTILSAHGTSLTFTCAEQFYMFSKSLFFGDAQTYTRILSTTDPKEQKKFGQKVVGFDEWKWTCVKSRVCRVGNWYKFLQNEGMRVVLLGTERRELVEAARSDRVWGIGFHAIEAEGKRGGVGREQVGEGIGGC